MIKILLLALGPLVVLQDKPFNSPLWAPAPAFAGPSADKSTIRNSYSGQKTGIRNVASSQKSRFSGAPILKKSVNL